MFNVNCVEFLLAPQTPTDFQLPCSHIYGDAVLQVYVLLSPTLSYLLQSLLTTTMPLGYAAVTYTYLIFSNKVTDWSHNLIQARVCVCVCGGGGLSPVCSRNQELFPIALIFSSHFPALLLSYWFTLHLLVGGPREPRSHSLNPPETQGETKTVANTHGERGGCPRSPRRLLSKKRFQTGRDSAAASPPPSYSHSAPLSPSHIHTHTCINMSLFPLPREDSHLQQAPILQNVTSRTLSHETLWAVLRLIPLLLAWFGLFN